MEHKDKFTCIFKEHDNYCQHKRMIIDASSCNECECNSGCTYCKLIDDVKCLIGGHCTRDDSL